MNRRLPRHAVGMTTVAEFLRARRDQLQPSDVGLPDNGRRRTPGLRREEVAELAGLSTAWYTMFEMAKETRVSRKTLDGIARALKLSPSETRHLYVLADAVTPDTVGLQVAEGILAGTFAIFTHERDEQHYRSWRSDIDASLGAAIAHQKPPPRLAR